MHSEMKDKIKWLVIGYVVFFAIKMIYNHFFVDASLLTYGLSEYDIFFLKVSISVILVYLLAYHIKKKMNL